MFQHQSGNNISGVSVIELLVAIALVGGTLTLVLGFASLALTTALLQEESEQALLLAQELLEGARNFRDGTTWSPGIGAKDTGLPYYVRKSGAAPAVWELVQGEETTGGFSRSIIFSNVNRDSSGNIVESGGSPDSNTRKLTARVSWTERDRTHQVEVITYLTSWRQ